MEEVVREEVVRGADLAVSTGEGVVEVTVAAGTVVMVAAMVVIKVAGKLEEVDMEEPEVKGEKKVVEEKVVESEAVVKEVAYKVAEKE
eukprot:scaffold124456_cov22-Tisochrysis_lutea.AAC.1